MPLRPRRRDDPRSSVPVERLRRTCLMAALLGLTLMLGACGDTPSGPREPGPLDLNVLFQPATAAEKAAIEAEWATRDPRAEEVREVLVSLMLLGGGLGTGRVFSHTVDGNRHYGATLVPVGAFGGSLPVVVFAHGGDQGVNVNDFALVLQLLGERTRNFVWVIPSFRSERLVAGETVFQSEGEPSPWDRDVDDALALLDVALQRTPEANPNRIGVLGHSRGGLVALLMAIRDPRIDLVLDFAGPTDFFGPWVRDLTEDALAGQHHNLPGFRFMNDRFIQPLGAGSISQADFRLELVRRSSVLWADRLPPVQVHHGTADAVVPVSQSKALIEALQRLERGEENDEFYLYPGAGHDLLQLTGWDARAFPFLGRLLLPGGAVTSCLPRPDHLAHGGVGGPAEGVPTQPKRADLQVGVCNSAHRSRVG
jgi:pimeloyl-ACP methyl ester carboxylesterase